MWEWHASRSRLYLFFVLEQQETAVSMEFTPLPPFSQDWSWKQCEKHISHFNSKSDGYRIRQIIKCLWSYCMCVNLYNRNNYWTDLMMYTKCILGDDVHTVHPGWCCFQFRFSIIFLMAGFYQIAGIFSYRKIRLRTWVKHDSQALMRPWSIMHLINH